MKVFISHSTKDRWIAGRVAEDLQALGIETFLDAKNLKTGDTIDDAIQDELRDCDEILMLLSPTALQSTWVMLEIGGAKALKKRLIPIMLHIGANDVPAPLSKDLARDLNDIDSYYNEAAERARAGEEVSEEAEERAEEEASAQKQERTIARPRRAYQTGDWVKIPEQPQPLYTMSDGGGISWNAEMTSHCGKIAMVTGRFGDEAVYLDVDDSGWVWAMDWLEPAENPKSQ
jgi:hypothetical protein